MSRSSLSPARSWAAILTLAWAASAFAQFDSGSDGSDSEFNPKSNITIDLGKAITGKWSDPGGDQDGDGVGDGVYDPAQWAVVFKFTTINVPSGVTVSFKNHPTGAPVMWLAQGDVTISGTVFLRGENGGSYDKGTRIAIAGPGGFDGAARGTDTQSDPACAGFGPGGAPANVTGYDAGGGGYGSKGGSSINGSPGGVIYGWSYVVPLVGGSGGGAGTTQGNGGNGGAGGGGILIASSREVRLDGSNALIDARGGDGGQYYSGGGSGGSIRLISENVTCEGTLRANGGAYGSSSGGYGGDGRIRIDADNIDFSGSSSPRYTTGFATRPVFPSSNAPRLRAKLVHGVTVPEDPRAGLRTTDAEINSADPVDIAIEAKNIPEGTTVTVIVIPARGQRFEVTSDALHTDQNGVLKATAHGVALPPGKCEIQLRANWTP